MISQLSKSRVDSYKPGRKIPMRQLVATLTKTCGTSPIPRRSYLATLNGAKKPNNVMVIVMDSVDSGKSQLCAHFTYFRLSMIASGCERDLMEANFVLSYGSSNTMEPIFAYLKLLNNNFGLDWDSHTV